MGRKRKSDSPTRGEVTEKVERHKDDMTEKVEGLDIIASDTETVRETLENLDFEGTAEGQDRVQESVEQAENISIDIFDTTDDTLETIQSETEEYESELEERTDSLDSDADKVAEAIDRISTEETNKELEQTRQEIREDEDFLADQEEIAKQAREENEELQIKHRGRVHGKGS